MELMKPFLMLSAYVYLAVFFLRTSHRLGREADKSIEDMYHHNNHSPYHPDTLRYKRYQRQGFANDVLGLLAIFFAYQEIQNVLHLISA